METPEQCLKSVQSEQWRQHIDVILVSLLVTLSIFYIFSTVAIFDFGTENAGWLPLAKCFVILEFAGKSNEIIHAEACFYWNHRL